MGPPPPASRTEAILAQLSAGVAQLTRTDAWREWLEVQSRFHRYSFGNCLLIHRQRPSASYVAGFHAWRRLERSVRPGEQGIWILAPFSRRLAADDDAERRVISGFRPVVVFDVSQTDGAPLPPTPAQRLRGDAPAHAYERLVAVAHAIGYSTVAGRLPGERNGEVEFGSRRIRIEASNDGAQRVKTLVHELAHALLHENWNDRVLAELEAESVSYVVCSALGLQTGDYSFGYVASWAGGGDAAIAGIKASARRIQQTANRILEGMAR